ncbi:hypothetical protein ACWEPL_64105 [Nonomuraea sp. NPDC004186]
MTQVIPSPAWQELRDLVAEGRTADLADRVIPMLPGALGARVAAVFGGEATPEEAGVVTYLPPDGRY